MSGRLSPAQYNIDRDHDDSDDQYDRNNMLNDPFVVINGLKKVFGTEDSIHSACVHERETKKEAFDSCCQFLKFIKYIM